MGQGAVPAFALHRHVEFVGGGHVIAGAHSDLAYFERRVHMLSQNGSGPWIF